MESSGHKFLIRGVAVAKNRWGRQHITGGRLCRRGHDILGGRGGRDVLGCGGIGDILWRRRGGNDELWCRLRSRLALDVIISVKNGKIKQTVFDISGRKKISCATPGRITHRTLDYSSFSVNILPNSGSHPLVAYKPPEQEVVLVRGQG